MTPPLGPVIAGIFKAWSPSRSGLVQTVTIVFVLFAVTLLVFIWAAFFRKQGRQHRHHHHRPPPSPPERAPENRPAEKSQTVSHRRRIRRQEHRPRNPTLAEAGGLPPERADELEPPSTPAS